MSLVPFASSTPAVLPPAAARSSAPVAPTRPAGGAASPLPASRAHSGARQAAGNGRQANGTHRFASVLEAVQEHEPRVAPSEARPTAKVEGPADTAPAPRKDGESVDGPVPVNDQRSTGTPDAQTPWLLLALGIGAWADAEPAAGDGESLEAAVQVEPAPANAVGSPAESTASPVVASVGVASVDVGPASLAVAPPPPESAGPTALTGPASLPTLAIASEPVNTPTAPSPGLGGDAALAIVGHEPVPSAATAVLVDAVDGGAHAVLVEAPPPEERAETSPPSADAPALPTADVLSRWRAARRVSGDTAHVDTPALTERGPTPARSGMASVPAVNRLAQALGRAVGQQSDAPGPPVVLVTPTEPIAGAMVPGTSSARATEVLQRFAQGVAPVARRAAEPAGMGVAIAQALSRATPAASDVPAAPVPAATPLPVATGEQVLAQVVQSMKVQWKDGVGEAKLHLRPDALGHVSVSLRVEAGAVTAVVRAENPQVQEWILQHQPSLRQQMEAAGLHLDELVVSPDDKRQSQGQAQPDTEEAPRRRGHRDADRAPGEDTRFEVLL